MAILTFFVYPYLCVLFCSRNHARVVSLLDADIEIWNVNVVDAIEPVAVLGGRDESTATGTTATGMSKKKKRRAKLKDALLGKLRPGSHSDAVLSLSWHPAHR